MKKYPKPIHGLDLAAPVDRWDEGIPLGNGLTGMLLYGADSKIKLSVDRSDLWDLRTPAVYKRKTFNYSTLKKLVAEKNIKQLRRQFDTPYTTYPYSTKIPCGRIELTFGQKTTAERFTLDLRQAVGKAHLNRGHVEAFCVAESNVSMIRMTAAPAKIQIVPPPFGRQGGKGSKDGKGLADLGYPPARTGRSGKLQWVLQQCADGFAFAIVLGTMKQAGNVQEAALAVTCSNDGDDPLAIGEDQVRQALDTGYDVVKRRHVRWWKTFWAKSSLTIPDKQLEQHYYLAQYFYGAGSRRGVPAISLQGVWTADDGKLPPWKGDYHHDVNTQMTYWAYHAANHMAEGSCFIEFMWQLLPSARTFAREFYGTRGACVPGVMALDGQAMGGWPQYSLSPTNSAWIAHNFYLHWRYSMDRDFLETRAYPYCREIAQCLEDLLDQAPQGKLRLALSSSPEVHDDSLDAWVSPMSNYDLSLLRWLFGALAEMGRELGHKKEAHRYEGILKRLDDLAVSDIAYAASPDQGRSPGTGPLMICPDEELAESHRHFSHLVAIHPLGILNIDGSARDRTIIGQSLIQTDFLGRQMWIGFSYPWMACLAARAGQGDRALTALEVFLRCFISRNGFHLNGDYKHRGVSAWTQRAFTLEANFAAAQALHEMLLQSWGGVVRLFPALPGDWQEASFDRLRTEGAFLVSARYEDSRTVWVRIESETSGLLRLKDPFDCAPARWNRRGLKLTGSTYTVKMEPGTVLEGTVRKQM